MKLNEETLHITNFAVFIINLKLSAHTLRTWNLGIGKKDKQTRERQQDIQPHGIREKDN